jgi:D-sedoheptulose 7-phosphate isomerase
VNKRGSVRAHLQGLSDLAGKVAESLSEQIEELGELTAQTIERGGKLMFCGNGGSAADAQHLATEYVVRFRLNRNPIPAIALTTDTSLLTAAANDLGFDQVFARQVRALGQPNDLLFLHSTSGNSRNLLEAAGVARSVGVKTIALLARDGGALGLLADHVVILPTENGAHAQELHLTIGHAICEAVERRFAGAGQHNS